MYCKQGRKHFFTQILIRDIFSLTVKAFLFSKGLSFYVNRSIESTYSFKTFNSSHTRNVIKSTRVLDQYFTVLSRTLAMFILFFRINESYSPELELRGFRIFSVYVKELLANKHCFMVHIVLGFMTELMVKHGLLYVNNDLNLITD